MSLYHLVRKPAVMLEKNPVLVLLHGYGSNEEDLFSFASELPQEYFVVSARAPFDMSYSSYAWYAIDFSADEKKFSDLVQAAQSRDRIVDFLDKLPQQYPIDPDQITLVGFSQGAILSYAVALSHPDKIKQVAALSGYLNTDIVIPGFDKNDFSKLRFFISHGSVDQVVPVDWARKAKPMLDALHIKNEYHEYPVGHGVAPQNFLDFKKWLTQE